MAGPRSQDLALEGFPDGVNNVFREDSVPTSQLRSAQNIDLLPDGKVRRRSGYLRRLGLSDGRSAASFQGRIILADGGDLLKIDPTDFSSEVLGSIPSNVRPDYTELNGALYIAAEGAEGRKISLAGRYEAWAPEHPLGQPGLAAVAGLGSLPGGTYQIAVTFLRDGEESGAARAETIQLPPAGGAIQLSNIPQPSDPHTSAVRIYMTNTDGQILYQERDIPVQALGASVTIQSLPTGKQLETQFMEPVPSGQAVSSYNGRLLSAVGEVLYYSQALRYGLCNIAQDYFQFASRITMIQPVAHGVYVATEATTYFLTGPTPEEFQLNTIADYGAIEGTNCLVPASAFPFQNMETGNVAVWWSKSGGMVLGMANGQIQYIRDGELSIPDHARGVTMLREEDGVRQLLSVLQEPKSSMGGMAAKDEAVVTVYRNGIEI